MANRVFTGSRARLTINGKNTGIFNSVRYQFGIDAVPVTILGKYGPVDLTTVGFTPISGQLSGYRVPVVGSPFGAKKGGVNSQPAQAVADLFAKLMNTISEVTNNTTFAQDGNFDGQAEDPNGVERKLEIFDTNAGPDAPPIWTVSKVLFINTSGNFDARALSTMSISFLGLVYSDEVVSAGLMQEAPNGISPLGFS